MNMLFCLYNLLTGSLVNVLRVQVLFLNRYVLLLRRRCALYSVCLNYECKYRLNHTMSGDSGDEHPLSHTHFPAAVICAFTQVRLLWKYGFMSLPAILRLKWARSEERRVG